MEKILSGVILAAILTALAVFDVKQRILPNKLNLMLGATGFIQSFIIGHPSPMDALLGAVLGGSILASIAFVFRRLRGMDGLGLGDLKFAVGAGMWIGWQQVPLMLSIAAISALLFVVMRALWIRQFDRTARIAFGPYLCVGTFISWWLTAYNVV